MDNIIIENLTKEFRLKDNKLTVINNLNLEISTSEITVILGKSGCGKTTLLRLLSKLDNDYQGMIKYPDSYKSAFVFQEPRLMPWLTVKDNISFGIKKLETKERLIKELSQIVGLEDFLDSYPKQISGGMKQRVALARALAFEPNLIYMDEPFAALDYFTRSTMQDEIIKLYNRTRCGILFVTHNIDEAIKLGHRIIILSNGKIRQEYILSDELSKRDVLSKNNIDIKKDILNKLNDEEK